MTTTTKIQAIESSGNAENESVGVKEDADEGDGSENEDYVGENEEEFENGEYYEEEDEDDYGEEEWREEKDAGDYDDF